MRQRITAVLNDQTTRFLITGGSTALLFYVLSVAIITCGAPPFSGTLAAFAVALVVSYTVQHRWTFGGRQRHTDSLPRYVVSQACCALASGLVARCTTKLGIPTAAVSLASTFVAAAMSYGLSRYWVFAVRS